MSRPLVLVVKMIADQQESGQIESIFDGIVRLTGLDTVFYAELLFSINLTLEAPQVLSGTDLTNDEIDEIMDNSEVNFDTVLARLANDFFLPFVFVNNPQVMQKFEKENFEDSLNLDAKLGSISGTSFDTMASEFNTISKTLATVTEVNEDTSVNFEILAAVQDILEDSELTDDLENLAETLLDDIYENQAEFFIKYVSLVYPYIAGIINASPVSNKKNMLLALKHYFYSLIESGFNDENSSLLSPTQDMELDLNDELNIDFTSEILSTAKDEEDATVSKTLLLVMGLERESIQAPMLTQTTQLYEGDLAWRTSQELEIYCSIEALGRISDIFLNSVE